MNNTSTVVSYDEEFSFFEWLYFLKYGIIFLIFMRKMKNIIWILTFYYNKFCDNGDWCYFGDCQKR